MQKFIVGLISAILLLFTTHLPGQVAGDMVCTISRPVDTNCSPYPVLEHGELIIFLTNSFTLHGRYTACHHSEKVTITGRVKRVSFPDAVDLELLATEILLSPTTIQRFPRTIGTVTLNKVSLEGYFFDVWSSIRTRGRYQQDPFTREIRCTTTQ